MARREAAAPMDDANANVSRTESFEHPMFGTVWASWKGKLITRVRWSSVAYGVNGFSRESNPGDFAGILKRLGLTSHGMPSRGRAAGHGK